MTGSKTLAIIRSLAIMGAVGVITTGATFAALQSPSVSLNGNIINSATADLRISTNGTTFTVPSVTGFTFDGVTPGGAAVPAGGDSFYLKNVGSANLAIKLWVNSNPSNVSNVDLTKVHLIFTRVDTGGSEVSLTLKSLVDSFATGGTALGDTITAGSTASYSLKVSMDSDAISGAGGGSITGLNISFTGTGA
jgi:hypothetical protein